jgi:hypothetical protein
MTHSAKVAAIAKHAFQPGIAVLLFASLSFGQAAIQLTSSIGPPTSKTLVSGQNFPANNQVNLFFDHRRVGQITTDSTGSFSSAPSRYRKTRNRGSTSWSPRQPMRR